MSAPPTRPERVEAYAARVNATTVGRLATPPAGATYSRGFVVKRAGQGEAGRLAAAWRTLADNAIDDPKCVADPLGMTVQHRTDAIEVKVYWADEAGE